jgi:hypothetical protein
MSEALPRSTETQLQQSLEQLVSPVRPRRGQRFEASMDWGVNWKLSRKWHRQIPAPKGKSRDLGQDL